MCQKGAENGTGIQTKIAVLNKLKKFAEVIFAISFAEMSLILASTAPVNGT